MLSNLLLYMPLKILQMHEWIMTVIVRYYEKTVVIIIIIIIIIVIVTITTKHNFILYPAEHRATFWPVSRKCSSSDDVDDNNSKIMAKSSKENYGMF
jgi:hypothetical protein